MALGIKTYEQSISAGGNFDGTLPPGSITAGDGILAYPTAATGGLFSFSVLEIAEPLIVRSLELFLGGQSSWTVHKRDRDARELLVIQGKREVAYLTTEMDSFIVTPQQSLVVRTTGATTAMVCRVHFQAAV